MYKRGKTQERSYKHEKKNPSSSSSIPYENKNPSFSSCIPYENKNPSYSSSISEIIELPIDEADKHSCRVANGDRWKLKKQSTRAMENEDIIITSNPVRSCLMDNNNIGDNKAVSPQRRQRYDSNKPDHDHNYINNDHDVMSSESMPCSMSCFALLMPKPSKLVQSTTKTEKNVTHTFFKSKALKIYRKVKQPIHFLNSVFIAKKSKIFSTSSYPRSCLRKNSSPSYRSGKLGNDGVKKTVHFNPVSVITDENGRICSHKCL